jgi:hypothetical protein
MDGYKHYIRVDADGNVIHAFSDAFEQATKDGDILLTDNGSRHFNLDLWYNSVIPRWYVTGDEITERTNAEVTSLWQQYQASHPPAPSELDRIGAELVLRELETLDLRNQNEALGGQIVGLELRLLTLEGGAANV